AMLRRVNEELEIRVQERTADLKQANERLQWELLERKRVEEALRESEERWQLAIRGSNDGIWDVSLQHDRGFYSQRWREMLGYAEHEVPKTTQDWMSLVHPDDLERVLQARQEHLDGKTPHYSAEYRVRCKDGTYKWILSRAQALWDEEGKPLRLVGSQTDISDRKRAEEALRESESTLRSFFESASMMMGIVELVDDDILHISDNPAALNFFGVKPGAIHNRRASEMGVSQEHLQMWLERYREAQRTRLPVRFEYTHNSTQGQKWFSATVSSIVLSSSRRPRFAYVVEDISDRKRVEESLWESKEQLQAILDNSPTIIYLCDPYNRLLLVNRQFENLFNITREQIIGKCICEIWPQEVADTFMANNKTVIEQGTPLTIEEVAPHDDGLHTYITIKFPLYDTRGILYAICSISTDITERKQVEEERAKLIAILEATPDFISSSSVDGQVFYFNKSARNILGVKQREGLTNFEIPNGHPDWANRLLENEGIPAAIRDGTWVGETALLSHDGREIPLSQLIIAHKAPDGSVKMLSTIARDITQQKQIEASLLEAERRWRSLLENVRLVVVGLDNQGNVEYVNPYFLELVGYTQAEVLGKDWFETFLPHHHKHQKQNNFLELIEQKFYTHDQSIILTKTGEERAIAWNNTLLRDSQSQVIGTLSIGEDITERQVIERMKDEFISVVSHELRTPLTSIHGALNLLSSGLVSSQTQKGQRVIDIAAESAERLVRLVNDILELERLESGKISLSKQTCDAAELIQQAIDMMQVMAHRTGITLSVAPCRIKFNADPDRIIQVLTNLLGNAIKFSASGSTVWLTAQLETGKLGHPNRPNSTPKVVFAVKDRGRGIPADKLETIFERFHQVDASDSRKKGGTGLGLAICRSIVQQHGGRIWVESTLGEGSCFYFTLPCDSAG
ncbi:MAG TPA: PAS domain S-box protein, partial [Coleofasciculaceae cyanobacterium]